MVGTDIYIYNIMFMFIITLYVSILLKEKL